MRQIAEFIAVVACGLFRELPFTSPSSNIQPERNAASRSLRSNLHRAIVGPP